MYVYYMVGEMKENPRNGKERKLSKLKPLNVKKISRCYIVNVTVDNETR